MIAEKTTNRVQIVAPGCALISSAGGYDLPDAHGYGLFAGTKIKVNVHFADIF
jgi:hypothetical protein